MLIGTIIKMFERGNVSISGLRGCGKDLLMANVIARRRKPYISNVDYGGERLPLELEKLSISGNTYKNFLEGKLKKYVYPYDDGIDVYISDAGIYFPAQYCGELNKQYPQLPCFFALSRHLGLANVHVNSQALCRVWDKIREQSDQYIVCLGCQLVHTLDGLHVIQKIAIYDRYESANNVQPELNLPKPLFTLFENKVAKQQREQAEALYKAQHGNINFATLFYKHIGEYDTRAFKRLLEEGNA